MDDQEIFETVRRCYYESNRAYIEEQISEANKYLSDAQKEELKAQGVKFFRQQSERDEKTWKMIATNQ